MLNDLFPSTETPLLVTVMLGTGLNSLTVQLNLSRFRHTCRVPLSNRLGGNYAPNVSQKMC